MGIVASLLRKGVRQGLRRGLLGGERTWIILGAASLLVQLALKSLGKRHEVVFSEKLGPGERLVITHRPGARHNGGRESPPAQPKS